MKDVIVNKKVLNNPEYDLYFRFFKVAPFCLDDSFAHSWLLSVSFMRSSPGMVFNEHVCLVKSPFVELLAFLMCLRPSVVLCRGRVSAQ